MTPFIMLLVLALLSVVVYLIAAQPKVVEVARIVFFCCVLSLALALHTGFPGLR